MHDNDEKHGEARERLGNELFREALWWLRFAGLDTSPDDLYDWIEDRCHSLAIDLFSEVEYGDVPCIDVCDCCLAPLAELGEIL